MITELSDAIDCLYDTYHSQTGQLLEYGFTIEEAFWIHFTSVSFMPWSEESQNIIPLSHILKFYNQIYRDEIITGNNSQSKTFMKCLLQSKFNLAYALAKRPSNDESIPKYILDIGRCALPHINNTIKHALAGFFVISAFPISSRVGHNMTLGKLIFDINKRTYIEQIV